MASDADFPISPALERLLAYATDYASSLRISLKDDLIPVVVTECGDAQEINTFALGDLGESVRAAKRFVAAGLTLQGVPFDRAAVMFDTWITIDGERTEAVLIEGHERGSSYGRVMAQRYRSRRFRTPEALGGPFCFGHVEPAIGSGDT